MVTAARKKKPLLLPDYLESWFAAQGWELRAHQLGMIEAFRAQRSTLLIAPTGAGKTLASFIPSLINIHENQPCGLHTVYISPLKALTNDIERNLIRPIKGMNLEVTVESRTGDTPSHKRQRQRKRPPNILLTTPESLMLMLSYADAPQIFGSLKCVIVDEIHSLAFNKRGDFTALALSRLASLAPEHIRFGLSATVAEPDRLCSWLGPTGEPAEKLEVKQGSKPHVRLIDAKGKLPYGGFMAKYAVPDIYKQLLEARTSIVFVNTRAQAELMFQFLWEANTESIPIAIYHGSLSKEQRRKTEAMMAAGKLRSVVSTSALELGIDWGDVDLVIQVGAPKGVSRLMQRIGRSNHRMDSPSEALLVPANRFEVLECRAAMRAIDAGQLDGETLYPGSLDVIVQYIVNCACSAPADPEVIYHQVLSAPPYQSVSRETFNQLFQFAQDGGYVLQHYDRFKRLAMAEDGVGYVIATRGAAQRHRQNIGTIVESARLKVQRMRGKRGGTYIGEVEESFAQQLSPGDTFFFAGQILEYITVKDMVLQAKPSTVIEPRIPSYAGGQMPLSTFLAEAVKRVLDQPSGWSKLPAPVQDWLELQREFSVLPEPGTLLVEHFPRQKRHFTMVYTFEGRRVNQTLGMLLTRRMERLGLKPLSFSVTDYALSLMTLKPLDEEHIAQLLSPDIMVQELEEWIIDSPMLRRSFRHVAMITGLTEKKQGGQQKNMKQITFSTDLIYDVLRRYEPGHILLQVTRQDAERELLDTGRLGDMLLRYENRIVFQKLDRASPMAIPILVDVRREPVRGAGVEELLEQMSKQEEAEQMMEEVRIATGHD